jgi:hypothetical protein
MDIADVELARQLALLHSEYFRQIAPQELLKCTSSPYPFFFFFFLDFLLWSRLCSMTRARRVDQGGQAGAGSERPECDPQLQPHELLGRHGAPPPRGPAGPPRRPAKADHDLQGPRGVSRARVGR